MSESPVPPAARAFASALIGVATGLRSQIGVATIVVATPASALPGPLRHRAARPVVAALALGEIVVDKIPSIPDRTEPPALAARLGLGALSAWLLGSGSGRSAVLRVATGAAAAAAGAFGGRAARGALARRLSPIPAALIEDAVAVGLAVTAVRLAAPPAGPVPEG